MLVGNLVYGIIISLVASRKLLYSAPGYYWDGWPSWCATV